ncbi:TetR/AcrR family transcriptional regulator C-terminal domain-containing protein [uncultured Dysosmobacter sp.]|uniref:TetR/AcrR family transcriptional regulator C-terminal domain-containing protein n=1 Tax=uncultured Dysosmobacter sp. TaxID=2591384 RepID=UPI00262939DE|nr:TetR/AcrR family transcriptional regulator C-terminal domain-containing protein [uncultured Dysosmobacter sp.]
MLVNVKRKIVDMFWALTKKQAIDDITVKDLVDACSISRQTFYYHFQDLEDVVEWSLRQNLERLIYQEEHFVSVLDALRLLMSFLLEQRELLRKLLTSHRYRQIEEVLVDTVRTYLEDMVESRGMFQDVRRSDLRMALDFYTYAIVGVLIERSRQPKQLDADIASEQVYRLMRGELLPRDEL